MRPNRSHRIYIGCLVGIINSRQAKGYILFSKMEKYEEELKVNGWIPLGVKVYLNTSGLIISPCGSMLKVVSYF